MCVGGKAIVTKAFWQAKIWGLLHDPLLKALYQKKSAEGLWIEILTRLGNTNPQELGKQLKVADFIAAASDRPSWNDQDKKRGHVNYNSEQGLHVSHLLSGEHQKLFMGRFSTANSTQDSELSSIERAIIEEQLFPLLEKYKDIQAEKFVFWWLWRCFPVAVAKELGEDVFLLPAETRIPDGSVWSHNSLVSALASSLIGKYEEKTSTPYLAVFTLTPVQELIKASRKMRDFWSGSWLLHYLSAKISWRLAEIYGADSLVYPCLYAQPMIDHWLLKKYPEFSEWIDQPSNRNLLTAGFPNVLVLVLPKDSVESAMQTAKQILKEEWRDLGKKAFDFLQSKKHWMPTLNEDSKLWGGWLESQWQIYWSSLPLGKGGNEGELNKGQGKIFKKKETIFPSSYNEWEKIKQDFIEWVNKQNQFTQNKQFSGNVLNIDDLTWNESVFDSISLPSLAELSSYEKFNVGLWWSSIFTQLRYSLDGVKNNRSWEMPTCYTLRSSISGIGSAVHPYDDWLKDSELRGRSQEDVLAELWEDDAGVFNGVEQLNSTEVLKRVLHHILPDVLQTDNDLSIYYPDLSSGVSGWLKSLEKELNGNDEKAAKVAKVKIDRYISACDDIQEQFEWSRKSADEKWGIPWVDEHNKNWANPRLINAGWLIDDFRVKKEDANKPLTREDKKKRKKAELEKLKNSVAKYFSDGDNPTDWYVLAVGDGDGMGDWLKGKWLKNYEDYVDPSWAVPSDDWIGFNDFLKSPKRMGPATHAALSRALLDFSNQLMPYLTEQRYAGRLIYGGGDDVLAYTNLWEWDKWLWDVRQCFRGDKDPLKEQPEYKDNPEFKDYFKSEGDYWSWQGGNKKVNLPKRPLFTMGSTATISFGFVIANHSVPLAIALENMWQAEEEAKEHEYIDAESKKQAKDAVQVRVIYGNGNILKATCKFDVFDKWKEIVNLDINIENSDRPALFEQAATIWEQHPAPEGAIDAWAKAFCDRREKLHDPTIKEAFQKALISFLNELWKKTDEKDRDREVQNWLKLAAFILRKRDIKINLQES